MVGGCHSVHTARVHTARVQYFVFCGAGYTIAYLHSEQALRTWRLWLACACKLWTAVTSPGSNFWRMICALHLQMAPKTAVPSPQGTCAQVYRTSGADLHCPLVCPSLWRLQYTCSTQHAYYLGTMLKHI